MGVFYRIMRLFVKGDAEIESEDSKQDVNQEEYASNYAGNRQKISTDAMDVLMLEDEALEPAAEPMIISEYDAGDVDFSELNNADLEDNSVKNVVVHDSLDQLGEHLEGVEIIGDIPGEVSFESEKNQS